MDANITKKPQHQRVLDHYLPLGARFSVRDYACDDDEDGNPEYDVYMSCDKAAILDAIHGTDLPNVEIYLQPADDKPLEYFMTFSVIDEGNPEEDINDWTIPRAEAPAWKHDANKEFERVVS